MRLTVLLENTGDAQRFRLAKGLSLLLETPRHRLLFDMGPNSAFLENAKTLGVNLDVDMAILSHGHNDHCGGLESFLQTHPHVPVYVRKEAFQPVYSLNHGPIPLYIGPDMQLRGQPQLRLIQNSITEIDGELTLFQSPCDGALALPSNNALKIKEDSGNLIPDSFLHEQSLLIRCEGKIVLIAGCAHAGIPAIANCAAKIAGRFPDFLIGGFHLQGKAMRAEPGQKLTKNIAEFLKQTGAVCYTGHCTDACAFAALKSVLGERLHPLSTGACLTL